VTGQPARGYSWPPFEKGHMLSVRHGAFSPRLISERAATIYAELEEKCSWLIETDAFAVDTWCRARARLGMLQDYIEEVAARDGIPAVKPYLWSEASRAESNVLKAEEALGLSPAGRAKLARDLGQGLYYGGAADRSLEKLAGEGARLRKLRSGRG